MNAVWKRIQEEPAAAIGIVGAFMSMLVLFGVPLSDTQQGAVTGFLFLVAGFLTRQMVVPTAKAEEAVKDAKADAKAEAIVERAMSPAPTTEEWATVQELRAERDRLTVERLARDRAARGRTP